MGIDEGAGWPLKTYSFRRGSLRPEACGSPVADPERGKKNQKPFGRRSE